MAHKDETVVGDELLEPRGRNCREPRHNLTCRPAASRPDHFARERDITRYAREEVDAVGIANSEVRSATRPAARSFSERLG